MSGGCRWNAAEQVTAVAHDNPIPGFGTRNTINLRLWAAKPDKEFDLEAFNTGDYVQVLRSLVSRSLYTYCLNEAV
jgi:glycogen phosphorylase